MVWVTVRRWKFFPSTMSNTAESISKIPMTRRTVSDSPNTSTPMATAVSGSKAPMMAVGVAPTSCTETVISTSESTVGTSPSQQAKNQARGDGGSIRCRTGEVVE